MKDLAKENSKALGNKPVEFDIVDHPDTYPAYEPNRRCPEISMAATHLGYAPRIGLDESLKRFFRMSR
jgi:UDP-glucuronate decarboxylase